LILKEFSVSSAPEVGRIIERFRGPSTFNFSFLEIGQKQDNSTYRFCLYRNK
jgi:hypothetical protein